MLKPGAPVLAWIPFTFGVHGFPEDVSRFTVFGMRQLFERAGFEVERIDEKPYAGAFLQMTNLVHFVLPRTDHRRWVRPLNKALFLLFRMGYPLDERFGKLKLKNLYTGAEIEARKPPLRCRDHRLAVERDGFAPYIRLTLLSTTVPACWRTAASGASGPCGRARRRRPGSSAWGCT